MSKVVSVGKYVVEANPVGLKSFSFTFSGPSEAVAHLESTDGRIEQRPVGLDGVPRLSPGGRTAALTAAAK